MSFDALELALIGWDKKESRIRSFVLASYQDNFAPVETTADPFNRVFALGYYDTRDRDLFEKLTREFRYSDKQNASWVARALKKTAQTISYRYPGQIGKPTFYAAINESGRVELPEWFPLPASEELATAAHYMTNVKHWVTTNKETAQSGTNRFFVGSVVTPLQGLPDTVGNNDGGTGAQYGMLNQLFFPFATFQNVVPGGNGVKSGEANLIDGNLSDSATYTVTGNSSAANVAQTSMNAVPFAMLRKPQSITAKVVYDVTTNSLNGANGPSRFNIDIVYIDSAGNAHHNNVVILTQGQTAAKQLASVSAPVGSTAVAINITAQTLASDTAGSLTAHVYEFWAEVFE